MVAGAGVHNLALAGDEQQRAHLVVGPANLVRPHHLQILPLQQHRGIEEAGKAVVLQQRRFVDGLLEVARRPLHVA